MNRPVLLRRANVDDAALLAEHRISMFRDMATLQPELERPLRDACIAYFRDAIPNGEYVGWIATTLDGAEPIAGAGVQFRSLLPRATPTGDRLLLGREGLVMNVYTVPSWRGRGVARQLMETIIAFAADVGIVRLVLHASPAGRPLYEKLGFTATREMIYPGPLAPDGPWTGRERIATAPLVTARPSA